MKQLEKALADLFAKAPNLPVSLKRVLVMLAPWLNLIALLITLPAILALIGIGGVSLPFMAMGGYAAMYGIGLVFTIGLFILHLMAAKPLFARSVTGWRFLYYAVLWNGLHTLVRGDILGFVIGTGLGLYIMFQIKSSYH
jgi:hypothetical protein